MLYPIRSQLSKTINCFLFTSYYRLSNQADVYRFEKGKIYVDAKWLHLRTMQRLKRESNWNCDPLAMRIQIE